MEHSGIVAYRDELERVVGRYEDFLGDEAANLAQEHGVPSAKELQASLAAIEGENRLLKIGVVGRVKSGKSSLLNALLFQGESILPKAATPMTAALTTLSYGESLAAEVEFFTQEDLRHIRDKYREYKTREERLYEKFLTEERAKEIRSRRSPEERASSRAKRAIREGNDALIAAYDQYDKIEKSGLNIGTLEEKTVLQWARLADLQHQLDDYVGATGRYMPVTKSVNIRLPQENLRDIEIVDTPGINDPVRSREERTQQHLRQCDVVLIVSPAGQFMTTVDLNLMDRITRKEGIRELYVVASQADMQLYGNLQDESNGNLDRALDRLTTEVLGSHLEQVIDRLKERNPEVGDTYDPLLERGKIIHTAGICESLKQRFEQKDAWDEGMQHAWGNLLAEYQNYFSAENAELSRISLDKNGWPSGSRNSSPFHTFPPSEPLPSAAGSAAASRLSSIALSRDTTVCCRSESNRPRPFLRLSWPIRRWRLRAFLAAAIRWILTRPCIPNCPTISSTPSPSISSTSCPPSR